MKRHDDSVSLRQMRDAAKDARNFAQGRNRSDLDHDLMLTYALTRALEILGEAASRVSPATREQLPSIPWRDMIGLRNRLIHGYDMVNLTILWEVVSNDLPPLIVALEAALAPEDG